MTAALPAPVEVTARAPAKVNVHLGVGPLREDGFHELRTVYLAVSLFDTVGARPGEGLSLTVRGEGAGPGQDSVPTDSDNLVWRAAELLARSAGVPADAEIAIDKAIPAAAGLAGGSADAAAALVALDALWGTRAAREDLVELAAHLGSDVPFSLTGGVALGSGRGERVSPVLSRGQTHWVLGMARIGLSTPAVYAELDRLREHEAVPAPGLPAGLERTLATGTAAELAPLLRNDLQPAALSLAPELEDVLAAGRAAGALTSFVSGSGPTTAHLVADAAAAQELAARFTGRGLAALAVTAPPA